MSTVKTVISMRMIGVRDMEAIRPVLGCQVSNVGPDGLPVQVA